MRNWGRFFPYFSLIDRFQSLIARKTFASDLRFPGASFGSRGRTHLRAFRRKTDHTLQWYDVPFDHYDLKLDPR